MRISGMFEALIHAIFIFWQGLVQFVLRLRMQVQPHYRATPAVTLESAINGHRPRPTQVAGAPEGFQEDDTTGGSPLPHPGSILAGTEAHHAMRGSLGELDVGDSPDDAFGSPAASPRHHRPPSEWICTLHTLAVSYGIWLNVSTLLGLAAFVPTQGWPTIISSSRA